MRTRLFLLSAFCFLLSESSYAQTITTAGVTWKGTNGADVFAINPTGSVTSPFFIGDGSQLTGISGGSSVTFNATQFGSSAAGTNIVSGALTTNQFLYTATIKNTAPAAVEHGVQFTNSANNELKIVAAESGSTIATISEITGITGTHVGDGSGLTGLNASALATGYVPRPVTNSAVKTGDLVVTNNATISGNISVAGTFNVGTTTTTNLTFSGKSNALLWVTSDSTVVTTNSISSLSFSTNSLATTITPFVWLTNSSVAAVGAQQVSPALAIGGSGWGTTGSAAQPVAMGLYLLPVQSTTPTAQLHIIRSINGGAWSSIANVSASGAISSSDDIVSGNHVYAAATKSFQWSSKNSLYCPINGVVSFLKADGLSGTDFLLLGGGSTAALQWQSTNWPALRVVASTNNPTLGISLGTNTTRFSSLIASNVASQGSMLATNGIASFSSQASVSIDATGWTNIWSTNNAVVVFGGTSVSSFKKRAGSLTATNITYPVFTGNQTVILQPGQAIVISGTAVTGSADPF